MPLHSSLFQSSSSCDSCYCNFSFPQCEAVNCCCIEIKLRQPSLSSFTKQPTVSHPNNTPARNTFSPPQQGLGQQSLFKSPSATTVVTKQVHVNRAFDDTIEKVDEKKHLVFDGTGESKLKAGLNRTIVSKVVRPVRCELNDDASQIKVKGRRIRQQNNFSGSTDRIESDDKNPVEEINHKKKCRKKRTKRHPVKPRDVSSAAAPVLERRDPPSPEMLEAQFLPSSSMNFSTSQSSQSQKKVTWRKQPIKPAV